MNEWEMELQHLNLNGLLHIAGFIILYEGFLGIDPHANLFRAFFYGQALLAKGDPKLASVGGFGLQKRARRLGDYPVYTAADSNRGWHEEWFYIKNPAGNPLPSFTGAFPVRKESWTWGTLTPEKEHVGVLKTALWKHVVEEGLDGVRLFGTVFARWVVPLAVRSTKMWEYTGPADSDRVSPVGHRGPGGL
jgi:hypothetical protein